MSEAVPEGESPRRRKVAWRVAALSLPAVLVLFVISYAAVTIVRPAPPDTIRMVSGPDGSIYRTMAARYQKAIERFGVNVQVIPSRGSLDNLERLADPNGGVDVGFVQSGLVEEGKEGDLVSLGTMFAQPLMVYHRLGQLDTLSQLKGKRLAVGPEGSGSRVLSLKLLKANGADGKPTVLLDLNGAQAALALAKGEIDAAFLMGDAATTDVMRNLRDAPGVDLMNFRQAAGYARRFPFLTRLTLPEGAIDFGRNYPPRDYDLVGPTVELVARPRLHPALSDLLIRAAREIHGGPGLFRDAGQFPAPDAHDFPLSRDAERYYKSGERFLYERLPFWMASLVDRVVVVIVPLLVLIVPATRVAPFLYRWRARSRIYRWYGALMAIERDMQLGVAPERREEIQRRLDEVDRAVNELRVPLSFADQLYLLRGHVAMVRARLNETRPLA